jgi:23S rRNA (cytidine1920-2'-O)/16S rRNA (cytidine1409-2'-O)-methyltransferase
MVAKRSDKLTLAELLVSRGFAANHEQAKRLCLAGEVHSGDRLLSHPGELLAANAKIFVASRKQYVSRGGDKLAGALAAFAYDPYGKYCLDVGASTGGFSDCLLQAGAAFVSAVDVGYGQFDYRLRNDRRVKVFERTNISKVEASAIGAPFELIVADVSFSPLGRLLPKLADCGESESCLIALCKPQFELPKEIVKSGVVREPKEHILALESFQEAAKSSGWGIVALTPSPIRGAKGNIEFFFSAILGGAPAKIDIVRTVEAAHARYTC